MSKTKEFYHDEIEQGQRAAQEEQKSEETFIEIIKENCPNNYYLCPDSSVCDVASQCKEDTDTDND